MITTINEFKKILENNNNMETSTRTILEDGTIEYRNSKGELHREDGPAVEWEDGSKFWYLNDKLQREEGEEFNLKMKSNNGADI